MEKTYLSQIKRRSALSRNGRLQGMTYNSGQVTNVSTIYSSGYTSVGHSHANMGTLEKLGSDEERYLYLTRLEENEESSTYSQVKEKAKAGFADMAAQVEGQDTMFMRKDQKDTAQQAITFLQGLLCGEYQQGSTGMGIYQDASGNWHLETDYIDVRLKLSAESVEIQHSTHIGGKSINTAAACHCVRVEEYDTYYRCYFLKSDKDGHVIRNLFQTDDLAYTETFNLQAQSEDEQGNHFFWRLVVGVDDDTDDCHYIDLSKDDCAENSDVPKPGDDIILLGNRNDAARQGAIIQSSAGSAAPYISIYRGIEDYNLPAPIIHFSPNEVNIQANNISMSNATESVEQALNRLNNQLDGSFQVWQGETAEAPTLENEPATTWYDEANGIDNRAEHVDDYYITTQGIVYQYQYDTVNESYNWVMVTDQYLINCQKKLEEVQAGLKETGIDISENSITATADKFTIEGRDGKVYAMFEVDEESGLPMLKADYAQIRSELIAKIITSEGLNIADKFTVTKEEDDDVSVKVTGEIYAESGEIGGFQIGSGCLRNSNGSFDQYSNGEFVLYSKGESPFLCFLSGDQRWAGLGLNCLPAETGATSLLRLVDHTEQEVGENKIGIYLSVDGVPTDDNSASLGNCAIYMANGHIAGFRRRLRRVSTSETLGLMDNSIICVNKEPITLTLPANAEDGQEIWLLSGNEKEVNVAAAEGDTISSSGASFTTARWHIYIYDSVNKRWWYSFTNYD